MLKAVICSALILALPIAGFAKDKNEGAKKGEGDAKVVSGISIVGNNETPKSLYIVPWKSSEVGGETNLASDLLDERMKPVDKDVFMREVDFYQLTNANDKNTLNTGMRSK
jgi:hypothetical protein